MLPCEGGECLRHLLLGQAQPGALSLEVGVRPGPVPRPAGIGVSHMATVRYQAFLDVFEYILSYNNSFYSNSFSLLGRVLLATGQARRSVSHGCCGFRAQEDLQERNRRRHGTSALLQ